MKAGEVVWSWKYGDRWKAYILAVAVPRHGQLFLVDSVDNKRYDLGEVLVSVDPRTDPADWHDIKDWQTLMFEIIDKKAPSDTPSQP